MKTFLTISAMVLVSLAAPSFVRAQQVTGVIDTQTPVVIQGKSRRPANWFRAESQHFVIYSDTSHDDVTGLLGRLERFHYLLRSFSKLDPDGGITEPKIEIFYLSHEQDLSLADPATSAFDIGLYKSCEDGVQGYGVHMYATSNPDKALEKQPENEGLSYIFQAYARHFFYRHSYQKTPVWFIDGFAHYFSTARFDGNEAVVGLAPRAFVAYTRGADEGMRYSLNYKDILLQDDSAADEAGVRNEFEARAWILTHYILSSPANMAKFQAYSIAVAQGQPPLDAFTAAFSFSPGKIDGVLKAYARKSLTAVKLNYKALPEATIAFQALPASANSLLLAQSALKACPTAKAGSNLLKNTRAEATRFPGSPLAQLTLARAEIIAGKPQNAVVYLTQATTDAPGDFEAQHLLGRAHLALAIQELGGLRADHLSMARQAFLKASDLDPRSASNAWYYSRAASLGPDGPEASATAAAILAWQLAPEVDSYGLSAGLAYAHLGRKFEALQALHTVADNPRGRSLTLVARAWIDKLTAGVSDAEIVAAMTADLTLPEGGVREWTVASGDIVRDVQAAAAAEDAKAALNDGTTTGETNGGGTAGAIPVL